MARIGVADWDSDPAASALAQRMVKERGQVGTLYGVLLQSPPVADGWLGMSTAVRQQASLDGASRELAICRVAQALGCDLEVRAHTPFALKEGVSEAQLAALGSWTDSDLFSSQQRAVLEYADTMTRDIQVPDELFGLLGQYFDPRQIVELTATVGFYHLVARFIIALRI